VAVWPSSADDLIDVQRTLGSAEPPRWSLSPGDVVGGCYVCSPRGKPGAGDAGDPLWAAAATPAETAVARGEAGAGYQPGLLALREGRALEAAVRLLVRPPDVLLVDATGRDHPRRAGLALQLGAVLGIPTVGVTHRPLFAEGPWPDDAPGATAALTLGDELVGYWLRTRPGTRPLAIHAAWRTDAGTAVEIVQGALADHRTPEPLRRARRAAREARAAAHLRSCP
jgi:deoxyribonuclease V